MSVTSDAAAGRDSELAAAVRDHLHEEIIAIGHLAPAGRAHALDGAVLTDVGHDSIFNRGIVDDLSQPDITLGRIQAFYDGEAHTLWIEADQVGEVAEALLDEHGYQPLPGAHGMATTTFDTTAAHEDHHVHADLLTEVTDAPRVAQVAVTGYGTGVQDHVLIEDLARGVLRHAKPWDHGALYGVDENRQLVATGALLVVNGIAGISGLATVPSRRHHRLATVVIARAMKDAEALGARIAVSLASPESRPTFERLGFRNAIDYRVYRSEAS